MSSLCLLAFILLLSGCGRGDYRTHVQLSVSCDSIQSRLCQELNGVFAEKCRADGLRGVHVELSSGRPLRQSRVALKGMASDVVVESHGHEIDILAHYGHLLPSDWWMRLPNGSSPYHTAVVYLVRHGNPKGIHDWDDLVKGDTEVVMPNPRLSGEARWIYLSAWAWSQRRTASKEQSIDYMVRLFRHVLVSVSDMERASSIFAERGECDVLISWESEILHLQSKYADAGFEVVYPSVSMKVEPCVAVLNENASHHGSLELAEKYVAFLYSAVGQEVASRHFYRPFRLSESGSEFQEVPLVNIQEFGGWASAHAIHFSPGGTFDAVWQKLYRSETEPSD